MALTDGAPGRSGWRSARNILAVRLDGLGDVLMTSPAIRALRGDGERRVALLASSAGAAAARLIPEIDDVIEYDAPWIKSSVARQDHARDRAMVERLRASGFDAAVVFTVYSQSALPAATVCALADIPLRLAHSRENVYGVLTDRVAETEPETITRHEVRRQLDLVATAGFSSSDERMSLRVPEEAEARAAELLDSVGVGSGTWVVVHPGATASSRRYPWQRFRDAADGLAAEGIDVLFTGSPDDLFLVESIRRGMRAPSRSLAGKLGLPELAAVLRRAHVLIGNNSGPAHVAAAVGTPVVDLYALTNPQHTPWGVPNRVLNVDVPCRNCYRSVCPEGHHNCLALVPPSSVVRAAIELLELRPPERRSPAAGGPPLLLVPPAARSGRRG
ncbi:MAG: glycosyltransferase family 9 protein [Actinomycetota bacterium]